MLKVITLYYNFSFCHRLQIASHENEMIYNKSPINNIIIPASAFSMSSWLGLGLFLSNVYIDITIPGEQKPHWVPCDSASCLYNSRYIDQSGVVTSWLINGNRIMRSLQLVISGYSSHRVILQTNKYFGSKDDINLACEQRKGKLFAVSGFKHLSPHKQSEILRWKSCHGKASGYRKGLGAIGPPKYTQARLMVSQNWECNSVTIWTLSTKSVQPRRATKASLMLFKNTLCKIG